jgi:hypothetical protein
VLFHEASRFDGARRRVPDDFPVVVVSVRDGPDWPAALDRVSGEAPPLNSEYRVTARMVLNLMQRGMEPEKLIRGSFRAF